MEIPIAKAAFDQLAKDYFEFVDYKPHNAYYERPAMINLIDSLTLEGKYVLDAGCAAGWYSKELLKRKAIVTAIDISEEMVSYAKQRTNNKADIKVWNLEMPLSFLQDSSQDMIISSLTLHYVKDWYAIFKEFNRVLKVTGDIIISVQHPIQDYKMSKHEIYYETELVDYTWRGMHYVDEVTVPYYRRSFSEMINSFINCGFELLEVVEPKPLAEIKNLNVKIYEKLSKEPAFICFKMKKKQAC